jgi:hypothetical protein
VRSLQLSSHHALVQRMPLGGAEVATAAADSDGGVFVAANADGGATIWRLLPVGMAAQAAALAASGEFEEALTLCDLIPDAQVRPSVACRSVSRPPCLSARHLCSGAPPSARSEILPLYMSVCLSVCLSVRPSVPPLCLPSLSARLSKLARNLPVILSRLAPEISSVQPPGC